MSGKQPLFRRKANGWGNIWRYPLYKRWESCYNSLANRCTGGSMDRASDSGSEGWGFESLPVCQDKIEDTHQGYPLFYFAIPEKKGLERSNPTCRGQVGGDGLTEPNLYLLPMGADANESLPVVCVKKRPVISTESPA